jgi:hypothetical protein
MKPILVTPEVPEAAVEMAALSFNDVLERLGDLAELLTEAEADALYAEHLANAFRMLADPAYYKLILDGEPI